MTIYQIMKKDTIQIQKSMKQYSKIRLKEKEYKNKEKKKPKEKPKNIKTLKMKS